MTAIDHLPDYMKICFRVLNDMTNEISLKVYQKHGWNPLHSLKKTVTVTILPNLTGLSWKLFTCIRSFKIETIHSVAVGESVQCIFGRSKMVCIRAPAEGRRVLEEWHCFFWGTCGASPHFLSLGSKHNQRECGVVE